MLNILIIIQLVLTVFMLVAVFLPAVKNTFWIFRVFEYPRFQIWLITLFLLASWPFTFFYSSPVSQAAAFLLLGAFIYLTFKIWPYTSLAPRQMKSIRGNDKLQQLRIYTANVYQDNREYGRILNQIRSSEPDVILLLETDEAWKQEMDALLDEYPNYLGHPQGNTYGMLFYTRLEIRQGKVQFLVDEEIPSIEATLLLRSGQPICVWAVHPKPPVPGEAEDSDDKDKEIMKIGFRAADATLPAIVLGDFNDVAWSRVTELFQKTSHLLDPRRGRGFYSTFSAHSVMVRFPLDYIFCSKEFGLINMKRLPKNGSDHFAIFTHLEYQPSLKAVQEAPQTTADEHEEALEKATSPG